MRSDDLGQTFNILGVPGIGKHTTCPGGGDEDIATDVPSDLYFFDLGGEPGVPAAVTPDHGNNLHATRRANDTANDPNRPTASRTASGCPPTHVQRLEWFICRDGLLSPGTLPHRPVSGHPIYGEYIEHAPLPWAPNTAGTANRSPTSLCTGAGGIDAPCVTDVAIAGNAVTDNYGPQG